ncbi:hypothetical protein K438DRAFT_1998825 [Mycena galopus ATCC 62051]|nr:hypothetical protein K438DRAFT_1998825 [Mycena galopus ATCC 62051]
MDNAADIRHARPFMSTWATRLVASEARKQVGRVTVDDPEDPESRVQLRASSNGRGNSAAHVITWRDFRNFMFLTKYMSAPRVKGVFIERRRRPYPMIQVAALTSFILARNPYATGPSDGEEMRAETADANSRDETDHCLLLDSVQEYDTVYEQGMGRVSTLKVGTTGTKVKIQPCAPGAFSAHDYYTDADLGDAEEEEADPEDEVDVHSECGEDEL